MYTHTHNHTYIHTRSHIRRRTCTHTRSHYHTHKHTHKFMYTYTIIHTRAHLHTHTYSHIHVNIHIHKQGNWVSGHRDGMGAMHYPSGNHYQGQWAADKVRTSHLIFYRFQSDIQFLLSKIFGWRYSLCVRFPAFPTSKNDSSTHKLTKPNNTRAM